MRLAAQAAGFGIYDLDCVTGDSLWSPELRAMAGLPPGSEPLTTEQAESLIHPEDRRCFMDKLRASLKPGGTGELEEEVRTFCSGAVRWVRIRGRTFFAGEGETRRPIGATGVVMDITASRSSEQALAESREELDKMMEAAIDSIITIDADRRITRFNPAASRMFGYRAEEILGSPVERLMPERFRQGHVGMVRAFADSAIPAKALASSSPRFIGLRMNGEEFPFEATITKVNVDGYSRMTTFMRDITERVNAEEALRHSKEDLELAIRGANIGIWHWDIGSGQVELSDCCRELFGIPEGEDLNLDRILMAIHPDDRKTVQAVLARALEQGVEYRFEKRFLWSDGSVHWLECMGRYVYDPESGKVAGLRGVSIDVTERKRHEEELLHSKEDLQSRVEERTAELRQANEALERSNLELQQFAFVAAHDLQTPLRSIMGFAQLLQQDYQGRLDAQADVWLGQLSRSAQHMHDLIRDVLSYSRVESRGNVFEPTDLNHLVRDVAGTLDAPIREMGGQVTWDPLPTVACDRIQIGQVFQNLIDNGLKYHAEAPRVHVSASRQEGAWVISVRDNGIGIADKHRERIFDIFRRLHTQESYSGTGIGLAVCRRIVHRHGGRIWVESEPEKGSVFRFSLPDRRDGETAASQAPDER